MKMKLFVSELLIGLSLLNLNRLGTAGKTGNTSSAAEKDSTKNSSRDHEVTFTSKYTTQHDSATTKKKSKAKQTEEKLKERLKNSISFGFAASCVLCFLLGVGVTLWCVHCSKQRKKKRLARTAIEMVPKRIEPENQSYNYCSVASDASHSAGSRHVLTCLGTRCPDSTPNLSPQSALPGFVQPHPDYTLAKNPNLHSRTQGLAEKHFHGDKPQPDYFVLEAQSSEEAGGHVRTSVPTSGAQFSQERPLPTLPDATRAAELNKGTVGPNRKDMTSSVPLDLASSYPPVEQDEGRRKAHIKTYQPLLTETSAAPEPTYEELQ